jgi:tyrosinase-like protein
VAVDVRRNIYRLGAGVATFTAAMNALKTNGTYDMFIHRHHDAMMNPSVLPTENPLTTDRNSAHRGPAFAPWHRYYIRDLELQLQTVSPGMTLPYWDWATDASLPAPQMAPLWTDSYIGGDGVGANDFVPNGPFKNWVALLMDTTTMNLYPRATPGIRRLLGRDPVGYPTLPGALEVANSLTDPLYDVAPWNRQSVSFRNRLEGWLRRPSEPAEPRMHNRVHTWVGGDMQPGTSPNDPVFFLHHANVDRLWARWQAAHSTVPYAPASGGPPGHNLNEPMRDLGGAITPASVLNHHAMGYMYDDESPEATADACGAAAALTVARGATAQLMACYVNTGTVTWQRGSATQVNLVPAPIGSPSPFAGWASSWLSPTAYTTASQNTCPPGAMANFVFGITPPLATATGSYLLEGELVLASTGLPLQALTYRQLVNVQ